MLSEAALRQILDWASSKEMIVGHLSGDDRLPRLPERSTVAAAVLIPIVVRSDGLHIVLTQRTVHLRDHAGQISFPGGRIEPDDVSAYSAALREAQEEIGLLPHGVRILGSLRPYLTVTGYKVYPIVGWIDKPAPYKPDPFEVDEVFEVPLDFILCKSNHCRESMVRDGRTRYFYVLPYQNRYIWGATAAMLVNFSRVIEAFRTNVANL